MLGTYLLVFFGPGSVVAASLLGLSPLDSLFFVAGVFGGTVGIVILLLGRLSGAHINPAITVGNAFAGLLSRELIAPYLIFQLAGGLLAGLCLKLALGASSAMSDLGSTKLAAGITPLEGIALEFVGTFLLTLSAFAAGFYARNPLKKGAIVGGTLFFLILVIGPLTGASFNPARSLGPSLLSGYFSDQLVYYVGPILGGACAGLLVGVLRSFGRRSKNTLDLVCVC